MPYWFKAIGMKGPAQLHVVVVDQMFAK